MMEAIYTSKTTANFYQSTWHNIPDRSTDGILKEQQRPAILFFRSNGTKMVKFKEQQQTSVAITAWARGTLQLGRKIQRKANKC
jgi:hypothetical protein